MSSESFPSDFRSDPPNVYEEIKNPPFINSHYPVQPQIGSDIIVLKGTKDTNSNSKSDSDTPYVRKSTLFQTLMKKSNKSNKIPNAGNASLVNISMDQYRASVYLTTFFGFLSIGICLIEHEIFLQNGKGKHESLRMVLL